MPDDNAAVAVVIAPQCWQHTTTTTILEVFCRKANCCFDVRVEGSNDRTGFAILKNNSATPLRQGHEQVAHHNPAQLDP